MIAAPHLVCVTCGERDQKDGWVASEDGGTFCCREHMELWFRSGVVDPADDAVNSPAHYAGDGMECIDAIRARLGAEGFRTYCIGCAMKYLWRAGAKGDAKTDLAKAAKYMEFAQTK